MAVRPMIQPRSRRCMRLRKAKGTRPMSRLAQLNSSRQPSAYMASCWRTTKALKLGLVFSYWPRVKAWMNPSQVRG